MAARCRAWSTAASRSRPPPGRHPDDPARPSRRGLLLALACSVAALLAALSALPARWLLLAAPQGGIVSLADAGGTIWNGSAWIALGPPGARAAAAGLQWQWHWRTLEMELRHPWLQGPLRLSPAGPAPRCRRSRCARRPPRCRRWARPGTRWRRKARWNSSGRRCRWAGARRAIGRTALARRRHRAGAGQSGGQLRVAPAGRWQVRRRAGLEHGKRLAGRQRPGQPEPARREFQGRATYAPRRTWPNARRWTACCPRWDDGRRMW